MSLHIWLLNCRLPTNFRTAALVQHTNRAARPPLDTVGRKQFALVLLRLLHLVEPSLPRLVNSVRLNYAP